MARTDHKYLVAFFDILGFQQKFEKVGLAEIAKRYESLIDVVDSRNEYIAELFGSMNFHEAAYWTSEGDVSIFNKVFGAYASDSVLIWAHCAWPEARDKTEMQTESLTKDPASGWVYQTVPCDNFLDTCCDLICRSIELGLPFRGAVSMGTAVIEGERRVFLGAPLIEAARLEHGQRLIGASLCRSFVHQTIPKRFLLSFDTHLKDGYQELYGDAVLDWPRYWRKTRTGDIRNEIKKLSQNAGAASVYYENSLDLVALSEKYADQFESLEDVSIRAVYEAYSSPELAVRLRPVRSD
jgi:hypothetical protein